MSRKALRNLSKRRVRRMRGLYGDFFRATLHWHNHSTFPSAVDWLSETQSRQGKCR